MNVARGPVYLLTHSTGSLASPVIQLVDQSNKCVAISNTEVEMASVTTDQFPPLRLLKNKRRIQDDKNPSQTHLSVKKVK
ncbi:hypothetical protein WA026_009240 [Henosepilachna vigintioctopunctata]|uniref:Uncharacterized protein n=1 Tax=Henosepilachna vigintioctopunctata TaxID=420089 RepID=A0AAW1UV51_9CUCU